MTAGAVRMPRIGSNDDGATLLRWNVSLGARIAAGDPLCEVETAKAVVEIAAEAEGWLVYAAPAGQFHSVGSVIAGLADRPDAPFDASAFDMPGGAGTRLPELPPPASGLTKKAEILVRRLGLDIAALRLAYPAGRIGEAEVEAFAARGMAGGVDRRIPRHDGDLPDSRSWKGRFRRKVERVAILGGAGGAVLIADALAESPFHRTVLILDRDPKLQGRTIMGIPVAGSSAEVEARYRDDQFDSVVIAFNSDLRERRRVFEDLRSRGVPFATVIAPSAEIRSGVSLGAGNVILSGSYIGPWATLGDNNFLSSRTLIEHHCRLGSHCAFGPAVSFSGEVIAGDGIRFGTQIAVEPRLEIGDGAVIASGVVITASVPPGATVKAAPTGRLRPPS